MIAISLDAQQRCSRRSRGRQAAARPPSGRARQLRRARAWRMQSTVVPLRRAFVPCWVGSAFRAPMEDEF
ncbi:hypothetical protein B7760_05168 [Burkholderia glumae]|nr:hypothetical protein KS03_3659 [Burkholderia glumae LMG 2196 = ATCC 33617]QKM51102.1 hypothetical protein B7760_05168 [Burkholderia glumae]QKM55497.1 hypothetical protein CG017_03556 [Burkholderia glumae]QTP35075.1 hypothetical protein B7759_03698 [Burkholderia glumae]